jgi:hypothetical protein
MANNISVTPLIPIDIRNTLSQVGGFVPSFNEPLIDSAKQKVIAGLQNIAKNQAGELKELANQLRQLKRTVDVDVKRANRDLKNGQITKEQFENIKNNIENKLKEGQLAINASIQRIIQNKKSGLVSFQKNIDNKFKELKKQTLKLKTDTLKGQVKSKADLAKNVLTNPSNLKAIYPALSLLITNSFMGFVKQRKKLEKQVDAVNFYIDTQVIDEASVIIATNLKNNTIKAINDAIKKLQAIEAILKTINTALKIASVALAIISVIMILVPAVPGAAVTLFTKLTAIVAGLSSIIAPCIRLLSNEIAKLKALIEKLKQIVIKLNNKTLNILTDSQLLNLIQTILPVGDVGLFQTLTAVPVSGSAGFVNIGGRIVPLNSTSAVNPLLASDVVGTGAGAGTIPPITGSGAGTNIISGTGIGTGVGAGTGIGTGVGTGTGTGTGAGTGTGTGAGAGAGAGTGAGAGVGVGTGVGIGNGAGAGIGNGVGAGTGVGIGVGTGTGVGAGAGIGTGAGAGTGTTAGTGSALGSGNIVSNPPTINTPLTVNTSNNGTTNGTGTGLTTTGGAGNGGVNVGPTGVISNNATSSIIPVVGTGNGLDNGLSNIPLENQNIFPINLDQLTLEGLDEAGLNELEQNVLGLTLEDPLLQQQSATGLEQVPSLQDQANLYKGFKFQIKEEQDPRFTVRGTIKRRYAVAINRQGVEVLKSEYSYTLDPNDLVDQLKLVIDKRKLQG